MAIQLNYKEYGTGEPLLILHGFMGSLDNWHTLATQFSQHRQVFTIDQRNHGKSPHTENHSIDLMVSDLLDFIDQQKLEKVSLIGHSMGGKVVMKFALEYPDRVKNLVIVDIAPRMYKRGHDDVFEAIFSVNLQEIENRKQAEQAMELFVEDFGTRQFLLKNLERKDDGSYAWKMNLDILHRDYEEIVKTVSGNQPFTGSTLVIKGGNSRYITEQDISDFEQLFPAFHLETIPGVGHWVHAEAPKEFFALVDKFLG